MKFRKTLFTFSAAIYLLTFNVTNVLANDVIKNIESEVNSMELEIKELEKKQNLVSMTADFARTYGHGEASDVIENSQNTWKIYENKKQELIKEINDKKNSVVYAGNFKLTGYCPCYSCSEHWGIQTASGNKAVEGITVAADPKVIPLGTKIYIEGVGERVVQDTGGGIKGNRIDIFVNNHSSAYTKEFNANANLWIIK